MTARDRLGALVSSELLDALDELVEERVAAALASTTSGPSSSPWLALEAAADYAGVSPRTMQRLVSGGRVRSTTLGRRRLFHRDDLDTLVRNGGGGEAPTAPPRRRGGVG